MGRTARFWRSCALWIWLLTAATLLAGPPERGGSSGFHSGGGAVRGSGFGGVHRGGGGSPGRGSFGGGRGSFGGGRGPYSHFPYVVPFYPIYPLWGSDYGPAVDNGDAGGSYYGSDADAGPVDYADAGPYPYPYAPPYGGAQGSSTQDQQAPPEPPLTVILRSGQKLVVQNYAVVDGTLWDLSKPVVRKIAVSTIDIPASTQATTAEGGEFPDLNAAPAQKD